MTDAQRATTEILAVSIDGRAELQKMADRIAAETGGKRPEFTMLSDPGHRVIDRYGLLNPSGRGWPHPTTYIVDRAGVVRWKFTEVNYKIRPTNEMVLAALAALR